MIVAGYCIAAGLMAWMVLVGEAQDRRDREEAARGAQASSDDDSSQLG